MYAQAPVTKKFSRTPCMENCKRWDTLYHKEYSGAVLKLSFGRREACNDYDTALARVRNDTIRIRIGEKKLMKTVLINGQATPEFGRGDHEECECFYDYTIEISGLAASPKALLVDRSLYIENKGFSFKAYKAFW